MGNSRKLLGNSFLQVSKFPYIGVETWKLLINSRKLLGNSMETKSLKALANKVLQRNSQRNSREKEEKSTGNFNTKKGKEVSLRVAYKVYSEILGGYLWVVADDRDVQEMRTRGISEVTYTTEEVRLLKGINKDSLKALHKFKEVFKNSQIEQVLQREMDKKEESNNEQQ